MEAMLTMSSAVAECWLRRLVGWVTSSQEVGFATLRRFQKEGSRAGVPIGCKTSAPSRGSKGDEELPSGEQLSFRMIITRMIVIFRMLMHLRYIYVSAYGTTDMSKESCSCLEGVTCRTLA